MTVPELNKILRRECGANIYGEGLFQWEWSEDLFWPAYKTGRMTTKKVEIPVIVPRGASVTEIVEIHTPEYRRDRMTHSLRDQWLITKWIAPEKLPKWQETFPGADYPSRGYRIKTDYYNRPGVVPTEEDTKCFIVLVKAQMGDMSAQARLADMEDAMLRQQDRKKARRDARLDDLVPAWCNPTPGKRGGHVSPQTGFGPSPQERRIILP